MQSGSTLSTDSLEAASVFHRRRVTSALLPALLVAMLMTVWSASVLATDTPSHYVVSRSGNTYQAQSSARTFTGSLKSVVESAVADLNGQGGGLVEFTAGDFDLGSEWFRLVEISNITFAGQGIDVTTLHNYTTVAQDTEPFNFKGTYFVTIRDLTVAAGGTVRNTSDALDFDKGNNSTVLRVKVSTSRGKGIIFDGKNKDSNGTNWTSQGNLVQDCIVQNTSGDGVQFLASTDNRIEGCFIHDTGKDGIRSTKSETNAPQPSKKSNGNVIIGNTVDNAGQNGIEVASSDGNRVTGNTVTNSSDDKTGMDGIRISSGDNVTCDDNQVDGNTATDNQATKTQVYGLNIASALCHRTVVGTNNFAGNKTGTIHDKGTGTIFGSPDVDPPSKPLNLTANASAYNRVDLTWSASSDNVGVTAYDVFRDGSQLTSVGAVTTYSDTTVLASTSYSYTVRARDAAGNTSALSDPAPATTPPGPSVLILTPSDDAYVRQDSPSLNFGNSATIEVDNDPVKHILMRFTVSGLGGKTISSVKLRLYCVDASTVGGVFYRVANTTWTESAVTWANAPAADPTSFGTIGSVTAGSWYELSLPFVTAEGTYSIRVTSTSTNGADYSSTEGANPPQVVVTLN
jgi:parallel beta-helix repeat protein